MANYNNLKTSIKNVIRTNGNNEITGQILQDKLVEMVDSLGSGYQFAGIAIPSTVCGTPDQKVFYIASQKGTYTNFNGISLSAGEVAILVNENGTWKKLSSNVESKDIEDFAPVIVMSAAANIPNIDTQNLILDLGTDPVIIAGKSKYTLTSLISDADEYRKIDISYIGTTALVVIFNKSTNKLYTKAYNATRNIDELVLGVVRLSTGTNHPYYSSSFFFNYTIDGNPTADGRTKIIDATRTCKVIAPINKSSLPINLDTENYTLEIPAGVRVFLENPKTPIQTEESQTITLNFSGRGTNYCVLLFNASNKQFRVTNYSNNVGLDEYYAGFYTIYGEDGAYKVTQWDFNFELTVNHNAIKKFTNEDLALYSSNTRAYSNLTFDKENVIRVVFSMKEGYDIAIAGSHKGPNETSNNDQSGLDTGWMQKGTFTFNVIANKSIFFRFRKSDNAAFTLTEIVDAIEYIGFVYGNSLYDNLANRVSPGSTNVNSSNAGDVVIINQSRSYININSAENYVDFGDDPVFIINNKYYTLISLDSDKSYRKVPIDPADSSVKMFVFNTKTYKIRSLIYSNIGSISNDEFILGHVKLFKNGQFCGAYFRGAQWTINGGELPSAAVRHMNIDRGIKIIAHRGAHFYNAPENSIDAYRYAGQFGYDMAETDVQPTKDGVLVLMHDDTINRTMRNKSDYSTISSQVVVAQTNYKDLRDNYVLASEDTRFRRPIPTLEEYLLVCREYGTTPLIELKNNLKNEDAKKSFDLACEILGEGNFAYCSFSPTLLDYIRTLSKKTTLYYIGTSILGTTNSIDSSSREDPMNVWYPSENELMERNDAASIVKEYRKKGMRVAVWSPSCKEFHKYAHLGVDVASDDTAPTTKLLSGAVTSVMSPMKYTITGEFELEGNSIKLKKGAIIRVDTLQNFIGINFVYASIIFKGSITYYGGSHSTSVESMDDYYRLYGQELTINSGNTGIYITAVEDTELQVFDVCICSF